MEVHRSKAQYLQELHAYLGNYQSLTGEQNLRIHSETIVKESKILNIQYEKHLHIYYFIIILNVSIRSKK